MSKSLGNVVDPADRMQRYGVDAFRYFLLKDGRLASDGGVQLACVLACVYACARTALAESFLGSLLVTVDLSPSG